MLVLRLLVKNDEPTLRVGDNWNYGQCEESNGNHHQYWPLLDWQGCEADVERMHFAEHADQQWPHNAAPWVGGEESIAEHELHPEDGGCLQVVFLAFKSVLLDRHQRLRGEQEHEEETALEQARRSGRVVMLGSEAFESPIQKS